MNWKKFVDSNSGKAVIIFFLCLFLIIGCFSLGHSDTFVKEEKEAIKEIYPFESDDIVLARAEEVSTFMMESGFFVDAASDQLLVYFRDDVSDEEIEGFVDLVHEYNGYVVGQMPSSKMVQLKIEPKEALLDLKERLEKAEYVKRVGFNLVGGLDSSDVYMGTN